jgi:hypothetical protein
VFWALVVTPGAQTTHYISDVLRMINSRRGWRLRYKPLWVRLGKQAVARFMRQVFQSLCVEMTTQVLRRRMGSEVRFFSEIFADDVTGSGTNPSVRLM